MTPEEAEALRLELLCDANERFRRWRARHPADSPADASPAAEPELLEDLERLHAENVRRHGAARANLARWTALLRLSDYLMRAEQRRTERALLEALEALERARAAELGAARWLRISAWIARRVDEAAQRMGRRTKIVTRIDFSPDPKLAEYGEALEADDLITHEESDEIPW